MHLTRKTHPTTVSPSRRTCYIRVSDVCNTLCTRSMPHTLHDCSCLARWSSIQLQHHHYHRLMTKFDHQSLHFRRTLTKRRSANLSTFHALKFFPSPDYEDPRPTVAEPETFCVQVPLWILPHVIYTVLDKGKSHDKDHGVTSKNNAGDGFCLQKNTSVRCLSLC